MRALLGSGAHAEEPTVRPGRAATAMRVGNNECSGQKKLPVSALVFPLRFCS